MIPLYALVLSCLSFLVSAYAVYRGSEHAQNARLRKERLRIVAAKTLVVWDQMSTLLAAKTSGFSVNSYFFASFQRNVHRLEDAIDSALSAGLLKEVMGVRQNALPLYCAFIQSLAHMENLDPQSAELDEWIKQHFVMGMIRTMDFCIDSKASGLPKKAMKEICSKVSELRDEAWTYVRTETVSS